VVLPREGVRGARKASVQISWRISGARALKRGKWVGFIPGGVVVVVVVVVVVGSMA
jgi:hypothetical protein